MVRALSIEEQDVMTKYPMGEGVTFFDDVGMVEPGRVVALSDTVNGDPIVDPRTGTAWIPLSCERGGLEPTNVDVSEQNIAIDAGGGDYMSSDIQPTGSTDAPVARDSETISVHFTLPRWAVEEAGLDGATLDETAREALALELFRSGRLSRPDLGRVLGLDRFETAAFLKRHQLFDDPTHEEVDAEVEATRKLLGPSRP
jgi:hypothetical protein